MAFAICHRWSSNSVLWSTFSTEHICVPAFYTVPKFPSSNRSKKGYSWFRIFTVFWMFYAFFWVIPRHLNYFCQGFGTHCLFHLQTKCYGTLTYKIQMPGNYPEESIQQWQVCYQVIVIKKCIYLSWGLGTVLSMTDANRHLQWPHICFVTVTL